jgi:hypothetical protein
LERKRVFISDFCFSVKRKREKKEEEEEAFQRKLVQNYTYNRILITLTANRSKFIGLTAPGNKILYVFKILVFVCVCVFEFFV